MWQLKRFNNISVALIYIAFYSLFGLAIFLSSSTIPLWALLLQPSITLSNNNEQTKEN